MKQKQGKRLKRCFAIFELTIEFLWSTIGLKWQIQAWGWFPILFLAFLDICKCWPNVWPRTRYLLQEYFKNTRQYQIFFKQIILGNMRIWKLGNWENVRTELFGNSRLWFWHFEMMNLWDLKSSRFYENHIGIHPQALIRHFRPIIDHINQQVTWQTQKKTQTSPNVFAFLPIPSGFSGL